MRKINLFENYDMGEIVNWCPISDPLPEGWYAPVTILPVDYFNVQLLLNFTKEVMELI